jgi:methyltransferase (TIGR00027 family)
VSTLKLEHLRKRARALVKASPQLPLHAALLTVARENGFSSWPRLRAHVRSECVRRPLMLAGLLAAANRAAETARPNALYLDPLACELAGEAGRAIWAATRKTAWPGYLASEPDPGATILTKFFDDAVCRAVVDAGIEQVVIVNAGMDTRAFRLAWPAGLRLFEVDTADVFEHKETVLRRLAPRPACHRQIVGVARDGALAERLRRKGFDPSRRAVFLIERAQYMSETVAERTIGEVTAIASAGSWMGIALVSRETLRTVFMKIFFDKLASLGLPPWTFGVDDPDRWLNEYGWTTHTIVAGDPAASYGRWPYGYTPRDTPAVPRIFMTQAWKRAEAVTGVTTPRAAACDRAPAPR